MIRGRVQQAVDNVVSLRGVGIWLVTISSAHLTGFWHQKLQLIVCLHNPPWTKSSSRICNNSLSSLVFQVSTCLCSGSLRVNWFGDYIASSYFEHLRGILTPIIILVKPEWKLHGPAGSLCAYMSLRAHLAWDSTIMITKFVTIYESVCLRACSFKCVSWTCNYSK
jgi:hypothetical protein